MYFGGLLMACETTVDRIRTLANAQGLSLPALEVKLNLGNGTISRWSKSAPNTDKLSRVADYFHVSLDYLLGRAEKNPLDKPEPTEREQRILEALRAKTPAEQKALLTLLGISED
jgi:transcriptional regulator with XRE-family HTH domain